MPYFRYKAVNAAGETIEGEIEALDQSGVLERLHADGCIPVRAIAVGTNRPGGRRFRSGFGGGQLPIGDLALVSREMATLIQAGLPIDRALTTLASLADKPQKRDFVKTVLEKVRTGATLADALEERRDALPSYYVGMVRAGEASNNLGTVFERLSELLERTRSVQENIKSASFYPIIVLVVAGFTIAVLLTVVVPEFRPLFENAGATLPWSTRMVIAAGDLLRDFWWALALAVVGAVVAVRWHYAQAGGRALWDALFLRLPVIGGLILKLEVARFTRTLGTLLGAGVVELNALNIAVRTVANRSVAEALSTVGARLRRGDGWSAPLRDSKVFPELAIQLIQVGEDAGQLDRMLMQAAEIFDADAQRTLQRLLALLVPAITIVLGLIVAVIIGAMLTAILSTYSMPI
jgi:general secretion pathway protein F